VGKIENGPDSDLDIVIDIDPEAHVTLFDYVGLQDYIAGLFNGRTVHRATSTVTIRTALPRAASGRLSDSPCRSYAKSSSRSSLRREQAEY
jgi:hypothetical protein